MQISKKQGCALGLAAAGLALGGVLVALEGVRIVDMIRHSTKVGDFAKQWFTYQGLSPLSMNLLYAEGAVGVVMLGAVGGSYLLTRPEGRS